MWLAITLFLVAVARVIYLELWLKHYQRICVERQGWTTCEIRRRVSMEKIPNHVCEYPVPREERILVNRLLGLAIWHRELSIALPQSAVECLKNVDFNEFDAQFPAWLRIDTQGRGTNSKQMLT